MRRSMFCKLVLLAAMASLCLAEPSLALATGGTWTSPAVAVFEPTPVANDTLSASNWSGTVLSSNGTLAVIAASNATVGSATTAGKVYVWGLSNGNWSQMQEIDDPDHTTGDQFGIYLAMSADGSTIAVGSYAAGASSVGKVYVYTNSSGSWTEDHEFDDPVGTTQHDFGTYGVALSGDGTTLAVSAAATSVTYSGTAYANAGVMYVYNKTNGVWAQTASFQDPDHTANDYFGYRLALSTAGTVLAAGNKATVSAVSGAGKVYVYTLASGSWTQAEIDNPTPTGAAGLDFGYAGVAISGDGQTLAVGSNGASSQGEVYIFSHASGSWAQETGSPISNPSTSGIFGFPLQLSSDGTQFIAGSSTTMMGFVGAGEAWLYSRSSGAWSINQAFTGGTPTTNGHFGYGGVAMSGDGLTVFIGAPNTQVSLQTNAGEGWIYAAEDDVALTAGADLGTVQIGSTQQTSFTVNNTDSVFTAGHVVLTLTLSSQFSYKSANAAGGQCAASGQTVTCSIASIAPGASWSPSLTVSVAGAGSAYISGGVASEGSDPDTANNSATLSASAVGPLAISSISNQSMATDAFGSPIPFTVSGTGSLNVATATSNSSVVASLGIAVSGGCGETTDACTVRIQTGSAAGTAVITLTVSDTHGDKASTSFDVTTGGSTGGSSGGSSGGKSGGGALGLLPVALLGIVALGRRRVRVYNRC